MILTELYSFAVETMLLCFISTTLLIIWNDTNAIVEYARFFGFKLESYKFHESSGVSYPDFLLEQYSENFLIRLITCPICLCMWFSILGSIYFENIFLVISSFCISLVLYFKIKTLINTSDE